MICTIKYKNLNLVSLIVRVFVIDTNGSQHGH